MSLVTPKKYQRRSPHPYSDELMTEQHHKETCDIHTIMRKYEKTGILEHTAKYGPQYANYVGAPDFKQAMDYIANAHSLFNQVPAKIRDQFDNDAGKYLEFMTDEGNFEQIKQMGLPTDHLEAAQCDNAPDPTQPPAWAKPLLESTTEAPEGSEK